MQRSGRCLLLFERAQGAESAYVCGLQELNELNECAQCAEPAKVRRLQEMNELLEPARGAERAGLRELREPLFDSGRGHER